MINYFALNLSIPFEKKRIYIITNIKYLNEILKIKFLFIFIIMYQLLIIINL